MSYLLLPMVLLLLKKKLTTIELVLQSPFQQLVALIVSILLIATKLLYVYVGSLNLIVENKYAALQASSKC